MLCPLAEAPLTQRGGSGRYAVPSPCDPLGVMRGWRHPFYPRLIVFPARTNLTHPKINSPEGARGKSFPPLLSLHFVRASVKTSTGGLRHWRGRR
jgi:hypothetical protein